MDCVGPLGCERSALPSPGPGVPVSRLQMPPVSLSKRRRAWKYLVQSARCPRYRMSILPLLARAPVSMSYLMDYMRLRRPPSPSWLSVYPVEGRTTDSGTSQPVFVELGGNTGSQAARFKLTYPDVPGRVIWQDAQLSLDRAPSTPGVEKLPHDIFESPPIRPGSYTYCHAPSINI